MAPAVATLAVSIPLAVKRPRPSEDLFGLFPSNTDPPITAFGDARAQAHDDENWIVVLLFLR